MPSSDRAAGALISSHPFLPADLCHCLLRAACCLVRASLHVVHPALLGYNPALARPGHRQSNRETAATATGRLGIGHDTHRLKPGGPLRLGGVDIPHDHRLVGHSDADVLLHAVTDALLGAAALGDIGQWFPDTEAANKGRDSAEMLQTARDAVVEAGWQIGNIDCIIFAERPKLGPYKQTIRQRMAEILQLEPDRINVKAKTGEGVGPVGQEQIIAVQSVALLEPR